MSCKYHPPLLVQFTFPCSSCGLVDWNEDLKHNSSLFEIRYLLLFWIDVYPFYPYVFIYISTETHTVHDFHALYR